MKIAIDKENEVPVHQQLRQQIIFRISTGEISIGEVMPSVRELERRLKISRNTVSEVYAELVEQRWLVRQQGRRLMVVHPKGTAPALSGGDVGTLIEYLLMAAKAERLSVAQLRGRIDERIAVKPPGHLLIVEPEPGMGELLKYEVLKATGRESLSCSIPELRSRPELLGGAALLVPAYLVDLLDFVPVRQRFAGTMLLYSPFGGYVEQVRNLASPTLIGMISVSGPGMKTMDGIFAEAIGSRHQLVHFWMEWPIRQDGRVVIHRLTSKQLPPDIDVRLLGHPDRDSGNGPRDTPPPPKVIPLSDLPLATVKDLRAVDLLFCDSIAYDAVEHPHRIKYQLLSPESLREIAAVKLGTREK